ncbi:MAG: hypothetical protein AAFR61_07110 [Bacteroidota bacterium]
MKQRIVWMLLAGMLGWVLPLEAQRVTARLDLKKRDPKPDFYEYSPSDQGLVTFGAMSNVSSRYLGIKKYGADLREEWKERVLEQNGNKNVDFVTVIGPNILVFVSEFFPKEGVIKTYYYSYDLQGNQQASEEILSVYPNQKEQKVELRYILSPNKTRLMCYKNLRNRKEAETILYYLFDDEGDYVQNGELEIRYPDQRFNVQSLRVSNTGNIFVLGRFNKVLNIKDANDFQYVVVKQDITTEQQQEYMINLGDRYITDLAFRLDRAENIYVAGFYSNRGTDQIAGTLLQKITPSGALVLNANEAFDPSFLRNYLTSGQINRGRELKNFYMDPEDGIILRSDGGVLLLAEKFYIKSTSYRDIYGYWVDREQYYYEDVILTSVSGSGDIEWHAIVDKSQVSDSPASLSYFNAISSQGSYIFYEYKPRRMDFNIYYNTVGMQGSVSDRIPLLQDYRFGNEFYPRFCEQINNREALLVYMQNRGQVLSVVKVEFES